MSSQNGLLRLITTISRSTTWALITVEEVIQEISSYTVPCSVRFRLVISSNESNWPSTCAMTASIHRPLGLPDLSSGRRSKLSTERSRSLVKFALRLLRDCEWTQDPCYLLVTVYTRAITGKGIHFVRSQGDERQYALTYIESGHLGLVFWSWAWVKRLAQCRHPLIVLDDSLNFRPFSQ